jgi:hypothetical protein
MKYLKAALYVIETPFLIGAVLIHVVLLFLRYIMTQHWACDWTINRRTKQWQD